MKDDRISVVPIDPAATCERGNESVGTGPRHADELGDLFLCDANRYPHLLSIPNLFTMLLGQLEQPASQPRRRVEENEVLAVLIRTAEPSCHELQQSPGKGRAAFEQRLEHQRIESVDRGVFHGPRIHRPGTAIDHGQLSEDAAATEDGNEEFLPVGGPDRQLHAPLIEKEKPLCGFTFPEDDLTALISNGMELPGEVEEIVGMEDREQRGILKELYPLGDDGGPAELGDRRLRGAARSAVGNPPVPVGGVLAVKPRVCRLRRHRFLRRSFSTAHLRTSSSSNGLFQRPRLRAMMRRWISDVPE